MLLLLLAVGALAGPARAEAGHREAGGTEAALRALDRAYVEAWKEQGSARQEAAVLALFADDAVILPGGGADPRRGRRALREFWFPEEAPPTNVRDFEHDVRDVEVGDGLGVVSGRYRLEFEYAGEEYAQEGNFLLVARRGAAGEWKISRMIWNDRRVER